MLNSVATVFTTAIFGLAAAQATLQPSAVADNAQLGSLQPASSLNSTMQNSTQSALCDIYGEPANCQPMKFGDYTCQVLTNPRLSTSECPYERIAQSWLRNAQNQQPCYIAQNRRCLPQTYMNNLPISDLDLVKLLKPLHATGAICCATTFTPQNNQAYWMEAAPKKYLTTVECKSSYATLTAEVEFTGDDFSCRNSDGTEIHGRTNADCPIPDTVHGTESSCGYYSQGYSSSCPQWGTYCFGR